MAADVGDDPPAALHAAGQHDVQGVACAGRDVSRSSRKSGSRPFYDRMVSVIGQVVF